MRLKELRGLPVIDPTAARKVGTVFDYQVDPSARRLAAFDIDGIEEGTQERIVASRIRRVGHDAIMLTGRGGATDGETPEANEHWLDTSALVGLDVMGDDGNRIGRLVDASFDQDTLEIDAYLLQHASLWERLFGRRGRIQPPQVHSCSRELMIVTTGHVKDVPSAADDAANAPTETMRLKVEDRLPAPTYDRLSDREPVAGRGR